MTGLTRTERTYDGYYIDAPFDSTIIEMTPLWLNDLTLQIALSECGGWNSWYKLVSYARVANIKKSVPELDEALRWCAERRMGVRVRCVEGEMSDRLARTLRDWEQRHRGGEVTRYLLDPDMRFASHQLVFRDWAMRSSSSCAGADRAAGQIKNSQRRCMYEMVKPSPRFAPAQCPRRRADIAQ